MYKLSPGDCVLLMRYSLDDVSSCVTATVLGEKDISFVLGYEKEKVIVFGEPRSGCQNLAVFYSRDNNKDYLVYIDQAGLDFRGGLVAMPVPDCEVTELDLKCARLVYSSYHLLKHNLIKQKVKELEEEAKESFIEYSHTVNPPNL